MQPSSLAAVVTAVNDLVLRVDVAMRDDRRRFGELHREGSFDPSHLIRRFRHPQYSSRENVVLPCKREQNRARTASEVVQHDHVRVPRHDHAQHGKLRVTINSVCVISHYRLRSWWKGCISTKSTPQDAQAHFSIWAVFVAHVRV